MVFFVLPKFAPIVLGIIALLALILGAYQHYQMFKFDYRLMSWKDGASAAAPYILVGFIVLYIVGFMTSLYKSKSPAVQTSIARNAPAAIMGTPNGSRPNNAPRNNAARNNARPNNGKPPQSLIF